MRKTRFGGEQIIGIPKEHEAGLGTAELCRKHGISDATSYKCCRASAAWRCRMRRGPGHSRTKTAI
jgi:putative transposase